MHAKPVRAAVWTFTIACAFGVQDQRAVLQAEERADTIRQQLQSAGAFERIVVDVDPPLQLAELVGRADLVIEASTVPGQPYINEAGTDIFTDYAFTVHAVIKNRRTPGLRAGNTLTVRRAHGSVLIDDRAALVVENAFPPFTSDEPYFLFLSRSGEQVYSVIGGVQGVYKGGDDVAALGARPPADGEKRPVKVSRAAFVGEVRALLKFAN